MGMNIFFRTFLLATFVFSYAVVARAAYTNNTCNNSCSNGTTCMATANSQNGGRLYECRSTGSSAAVSNAMAGAACGQLATYKQKCETELAETASNCDEKGNQGMNNVSSMAGQVALAFGAQSASSIQAACSSSAALSAAANAALAAYRLTCSSSIQDCSTSCNAYVNYAKSCAASNPAMQSAYVSAQEAPRQCSNYTAKIGEAQQAMTNIAQTAANASQCASLTSADGTVSPEICAANPTMAGCSTTLMDCNNPSMATNKVCICSKTPSDPACLGTSSVVGGDTGLSGIDNSGRLASTASSTDMTGDLYNPSIEQAALNNSGGAEDVGGKQGGGVSFGGSGSGAGGASGSGKGDGTAAEKAIGVNAGYYGSGSGGAFGGGGSDGSGGSGGAYNPNAPGAAAGKGGPDLRQFLPGGKMSGARGVAGATGPDGITGPHSDIWKKVNNRYQVMSPSLLP
ncbi:hypothetical protein B9G69_005960 [Bdellovibrio sp. SKB1291214]|uniref:hypothetical protein n=1 Tax=Bdellovibrio sp. SKB1291214 TaxID=1732569 RepID=UPI001C3D2D8A|nr:hypothetical protein [Bdellovibrio sp. SKB1291214]UYL10122.1 hypothetical protein B9G69_005960 [Bdellovibrio sp. SKB1291214]